jgi:septal ring factor EnvC (AmiA/AmiB activator)
MECAMFKSPVSKLLKFFRASRDGWKAKCQEAKRLNKKLANQTRAVEKSREHWKQLAQAAQQQIRQLRREVDELKCAAAAPG